MLRDAITEIRRADRAAREDRRRRIEARAALSRAEAYAVEVEDLVELERPAVPERLTTEIRVFVRGHSRRLARAMGARPEPSQLLDVLFDVQERIQQHMEMAHAA